MSEWLRQEQDEINAENSRHNHQVARNLSKSFADLYCEFTNLKVENQELSRRLAVLEEKERQRDRDEWDRELALDSGPPDYIPRE